MLSVVVLATLSVSCAVDPNSRSGFVRVGNAPIEFELRGTGDLTYLRNMTNRSVRFSYLVTRDPNLHYLGDYQRGAGTIILLGGEEASVGFPDRHYAGGGGRVYVIVTNFTYL